MDRDDDLISHWSDLLTSNGSAPPPPLIARCAATFGPSPDLVVSQRIKDQGTRWAVVVLAGSVFGYAQAHSSHPSWDSEAYVHQLGHDDGATYECWAVPVREVTRVSTLPVDDDGRHWRPTSPDDGGALLSAWRVHLRDGTRVDLPAGELPGDPRVHQQAEQLAVTLLASLSR